MICRKPLSLSLPTFLAFYIFAATGSSMALSTELTQGGSSDSGVAQVTNVRPKLGPPSTLLASPPAERACNRLHEDTRPMPAKLSSAQLKKAPEFCAAAQLVLRMESFYTLETKQEIEDLARETAVIFDDATIPGAYECASTARYMLSVWPYVRSAYTANFHESERRPG